MTTALLIIDIHNDYFPGGKLEIVGSPEAAAHAARLIAAFRAKNLPVIHVRHESLSPGATFFLPGTEGAKIHETVAPREGETVITKNFPNAFRDTPLLDHLRSNGIGKLAIAGMMTHMCIDTTTRAASDYGFECVLAHDACATRDLSFGGSKIPARDVHNAFIAALNGAFAKAVAAREIVPG
jgi:nicotinamidase-related amidase